LGVPSDGAIFSFLLTFRTADHINGLQVAVEVLSLPTTQVQDFVVGSLVRVRDRDWVVLPSEDDVVNLRPLSGSEAEICGVHRSLEGHLIRAAEFPYPEPEAAGDFVAGKLLRNAARLSLRSGAGPFRSLGRLSVRPRPYQFVPMIMALRLDAARLLIADDVGIGKTIEAGLIASELIARGDARRLCVLCPPHLCEQWQQELAEKFHIHAEVVRTSTVARLERSIPRGGMSLYEYYPHLIISIDFAKSERRKHMLLQHCPDLVIVDEVHSAADPGYQGSKDQQQRHELVKQIASDPTRHLLLLSATPHSGVEDSFRSLLGLIRPDFGQIDLDNLSDGERKDLARQIVQRRRGDISEKWLGGSGESRPFPVRVPPFEITYRMSAEYGALFNDVLAFTRRTVTASGLTPTRQRARYWAALSLLRSLMSSPAAAKQALQNREDALKGTIGEDEELNDDLLSRESLDPLTEDGVLDTVPDAANELSKADLSSTDRTKLRQFMERAEAIAAAGQDPKIEKAAEIMLDWLKKGHHPIVFCRFIATAKYVAEQLESRIKEKYPTFRASAVSGETGGDEERKAVIEDLVESERRVLVATDCLSEGINLQDNFDAVLHFDLPWNPNRLEQREGRVDRFGQKKKEVRAVVLFSDDNPIDGVVLNVLIRKARQIYRDLGINVPVPSESESVVKALMKAVFEGWRGQDEQQLRLDLPEVNNVKALHENWQRNADREERRRSRFAQHAINPEEVAREIEETDTVLGDPEAVRHFMLDAAQRLKFALEKRDRYYLLDPTGLPPEIRERLGWKKPVKVVFVSPAPEDVENAIVLGRNHPLVAFLADRILGRAFLRASEQDFARSGAAYTNAVKSRTVLTLLRVRYKLTRRGQSDQFAEEVVTAACETSDGKTVWKLPNDPITTTLLEGATAVGNITPQDKQQRIENALKELRSDQGRLEAIAKDRAAELEATYERLKQTMGGGKVTVTPYPPDLLGVYVLLPGGNA
jgi:superfamily II DNA or RNA helicase